MTETPRARLGRDARVGLILLGVLSILLAGPIWFFLSLGFFHGTPLRGHVLIIDGLAILLVFFLASRAWPAQTGTGFTWWPR